MTKEEKMRSSSLNVTDVEQSKKLDSMGLDPCSADFHWEKMEEEGVVDSDMPVIRNGYHLVPGANPAFFYQRIQLQKRIHYSGVERRQAA